MENSFTLEPLDGQSFMLTMPQAARFIHDNLAGLEPFVRFQLSRQGYEALRAKWPQVHDQTPVCYFDQAMRFQGAIHLTLVGQPVARWLMPYDLPGFKPAFWRLLGRWFRRPRWIARGQHQVPVQTATRRLEIEHFGVRYEVGLLGPPWPFEFHFWAAYNSLGDVLFARVA